MFCLETGSYLCTTIVNSFKYVPFPKFQGVENSTFIIKKKIVNRLRAKFYAILNRAILKQIP